MCVCVCTHVHVRIVCVFMYVCISISVCGEGNQPNSYSLTNGLLEYSLLYFDKCYNSVRIKSNQKSTLHKPTEFLFPHWKMQAKWQGLLAIECPDKYARFLANGIIKNSHNAAKNCY